MSLIGSLLALVIIPLKARVPAKKKPVELALDHWREAYRHLWRENERLRQDRTALLMRIGLDEQQWAARHDPASPYYVRPPQQAQRQQLQAQMLQNYQALQNLNAQNLNAQNLNAQNYQNELQQQNACNQQMQALEHYGDWLNCVPSRASKLTRVNNGRL